MEKIGDMIKDLPPELQQEVEDFVKFLLEKHRKKPQGKLKFDWEGALEDLRDKYTSVELQHKILEWWVYSGLFSLLNQKIRLGREALRPVIAKVLDSFRKLAWGDVRSYVGRSVTWLDVSSLLTYYNFGCHSS